MYCHSADKSATVCALSSQYGHDYTVPVKSDHLKVIIEIALSFCPVKTGELWEETDTTPSFQSMMEYYTFEITTLS